MKKHDLKPDNVEVADEIRLTDVLTFLRIYEEVRNTSEQNLSNMLAQSAETSGHPASTVVGQLKRIAKHFFGSKDLELMFNKDGGFLIPTAAAHRMNRQFLILKDVYERLKPEVLGNALKGLPLIRIGASQSIGLRLLSKIFGNWEKYFGKEAKKPSAHISVEILNSPDLIARLNAGLLDFVISYGIQSTPPERERETMDVIFRSFGYASRLVLLCHPEAKLLLKTTDVKPRDINEGYWDISYANHPKPAYEKLREVQLNDIEFANTSLIVVPTWRQPTALHLISENLPDVRVTEVAWYDEALALVRMGLGVSIAAETFSRRDRITAFRLKPEKEFTRDIGVYYRASEGLNAPACMCVTFIKEYMNKFDAKIRAGLSPALGNPDFKEFCEFFKIERKWDEIAMSEYPPMKFTKG